MSGTSKLPLDSFPFYVALGEDRSYEEVAKHFGVHKRTVVRAAAREKWSERLAAIEERTRELTDAKLADTLHERDMRHRKLVMAMAARAAKALQSFELTSCVDGVRVAEAAIKLERLISGQPSESTHVSVERVTRNEIAKFTTTDAAEDWSEFEGDTAESGHDDGEAAVEAG